MTVACMNHFSRTCSSLLPPERELISSRLRVRTSQDRAEDSMGGQENKTVAEPRESRGPRESTHNGAVGTS